MTELTALKQKRGRMKGKMTRLQKYYDELDRDNLNETSILQLGLRLSKFENVLEEFEKIQLEIDALEPEHSDEERDKFENDYFELITKIHSLIKTHESNNRLSSHNAVSTGINNVNSISIKLPMIKLPNFKGTFDKWLEFRDAFKAMVHNNNNIGKSEKFYYLKSSLSDEALRVIQAIEVTDGNYETAWNLLVDRYENKPLIVHTHIKLIFEINAVTRESHIELRRLIDDVTKHLRALEALELPVKHWDALLIYIIAGKLDAVTRREWEAFNIQGELPNMTDMNEFLKQKCNVLEKLEQNKQFTKPTSKTRGFQAHLNVERNSLKCYFCKNSHSVYNCKALLKLEVNSRIQEIRVRHLCTNCLRPGHTNQFCKLAGCKKCNRKHNTLLHIQNNTEDIDTGNTDSPDESAPTQAVSCHIKNTGGQVLLSTAIIEIKDTNGQFLPARALLDSGSQSNFITTQLCQKLGLSRSKVNFAVQGVGQCLSNIKYCTSISLTSNVNKYRANISCLVIPTITGELPMNSLEAMELNIPNNIRLADPKFYEQNQVDVLLGAGIFWELLCVGQICLGKGLPILQKTQLGWIVAGNLNYQSNFGKWICGHSVTEASETKLDNELKRFWQIEECINGKAKLSKDEQYCEDHFARTHKRNEQGRFIVQLPLRDNVTRLGDSRQLALERFYSLERKLEKNQSLKLEYLKFMQEYRDLGHMSPVKDENEGCLGVIYYLPHHAVVKESSLTTKVRVVFDASMKTTSGLSFNDTQYVGPVIQSDLISIILRFRKYQYVITADITKMYRQVLVSEEQRSLQRIFWRPNASEELQCYELSTVSYGTASAPYLATKCLDQLATEYEITKPKASGIIRNDFYVDDLLTGSNTTDELLEIQRDVTSILAQAGFELRKWVSNDERVMNELQVNRKLETVILPLGDNPRNKTLGVLWNARLDCIEFTAQVGKVRPVTKRTILSTISQVFDPLGLLGPVIIIAKVIIQRLWQAKLSCDEAVPQSIYSEWTQFINNLSMLNNIKIPRGILKEHCVVAELHGFSDASETAYGACICTRCEDEFGEITTSLLCAKSRVAPLKRVTLPRLELCAAQLLAQLVQKVKNSLQMSFDKYYYWSDSTITLSWIKAPANKWKTFVANRVGDIQELTNPQDWYHVKSEDNPADLLSRGLGAEHIQNCKLWWKGPTWLEQSKVLWNTIEIKTSDDIQIPEQRLITGLTLDTGKRFELFEKYSSITTVNRTCAYILRFIHNCKSERKHRYSGILTANELNSSLHVLIKIAQRETYPDEYNSLANKQCIKKRSHLLSLDPFIDDKGLLRVNGRIQNANQLLINTQPIILPHGHPLTKLIFIKRHEQLLHCGPQQLLYAVRELYWPIAGRNLARSIVHKCIKCFRAKPIAQEYKMGDLPAVRVCRYAPFLNTGIDYAGPFLIKDRKTRAPKLIKAYICLFICLSTKAVHLELVTELTTAAFLATLKRFMSRRGKPASIYSDNGTTFVGANAHLQELFSFLKSDSSETIINALANDNITWHFIPPRSPNFGGLWEAGIKGTKHHFKRVLGNASLDYEEFCTVLAQIEAVLNSRPISPLSSDPSDNTLLTPAHFLIGRALTAVPEPSVMDSKESRLTKYQKLQKIVEHFWQRWHKEYISELQGRTKWKQSFSGTLKIGSLVVIKEDNQPPLCWALGRITTLHPGKDGITKVVTIRTSNSTLKRPVHKICVLPIDN